MGCEVVKVYRDHGVSGTKGRDERPQFDCGAQSRRLVPLADVRTATTRYYSIT
jgi:hypothetical protein